MTMLKQLNTLWGQRELLGVWTVREVRVRYKQSLLGVLWALLQPLAFTFMFTVVFSYVVKVPTDGIPYPIFSFTALLPWTLLTASISFGVPSLVGNMNLVTKIYFPREILPLAAMFAALVDFLVASLIYAGIPQPFCCRCCWSCRQRWRWGLSCWERLPWSSIVTFALWCR
jgi:lipopolysaccharide transport system permease protein